jgi:hypothetical protein
MRKSRRVYGGFFQRGVDVASARMPLTATRGLDVAGPRLSPTASRGSDIATLFRRR